MESRRTVFKAGSKNPAVTETTQQQAGNAVASTQFTYLDVGVNIDCLVQAVGAKVAMQRSLDLSNITGDDPSDRGTQSRHPADQAERGRGGGVGQTHGAGLD
jgi:hypothetical protein